MSDEVPLQELTSRQRKLLEILIREYIASPEPVSSKTLMHISDLGVSSATVRNEMAVLEEAGYIRAPHTSAGRVPTEDGYRYMVKQLLNDPPKADVRAIQAHFRDIPAEMEAWMQHAAVVLANETHTAALVTEPRLKSSYRFKQVQLIGVQGRLVLMVLVLDGANVHQQMLIMAEPIPQERLNHASEIINRNCFDLTAEQIREKARTLSSILSQEIGEIVADALQTLRDEGSRVVYRAGLSNVLPDFEDDGARQAIKVLEGNVSLDQIVDQFRDTRVGSVHALVGGDGRFEEFNRLSMIFARYGTAHVIGTVGVVGPTRMRYGSAISAVSSVAEIISKFLTEVHGDEESLESSE